METNVKSFASQEGEDHRQRKLTGLKKQIVRWTAIGFSVFQLSIAVYPYTAERIRTTHVCLSFILIFLLYPLWKKKSNKLTIDGILLSVLALVGSGYAFFFWFGRAESIGLEAPTIELVMGALMMLLALEAARRTVGWIFPLITIIILAYARFGELVPDIFAHPTYDIERIITNCYLTTEGIYGMLTGVSASYIYIFILFGTFLRKTGAGDFFINLAYSLLGTVRGGPAKIAVIASSLFGMVTGSTLANVAGTGQLTIPLMKRTGYQPHFAAAVEAVASSGSQIMPPILGGSIFIMMEILALDYVSIMIATISLAVMFYFIFFIIVDMEAVKLGLVGLPKENVPELLVTLKEGWHFFIPIVILMYFLAVVHASPTNAGFYSVVSIPAVAMMRKSTRLKFSDILVCLESGAYASLTVIGIIVCAGILIGMISLTGLGLVLSSILIELSQGSYFGLLVLTMIASIILGMGVPIMAAYVVLAILVAPALINMGTNPLSAHLFILYFAIMSVITPPVAPAAFIAAGIANSNQWKTAFTACRIGLGGFVIPYLLIYHPQLLLQGQYMSGAVSLLLMLVGLYILAGVIQNRLLITTNYLERLCLAFCALCFFTQNIYAVIVASICFAIIIVRQKRIIKTS